ncbi:MAG: efflux RND transporter periplasmic adaptor subunit [Syntrophorhabdaceae bacterium]|nr:efflux RND transporter periplasmic adaptor subunit [Syntrophorhabdaceae bacterium]
MYGYSIKKILIIIPVVIFCLVFMGCKGPKGPPQSGPPEVTVLKVSQEKITLTTELPGRVSAYRIAEVRPQVSGIIQKRLFTEGVDVKAGEVLYQIDPAPFQAALDNAKGALGRAEANLPAIKQRYDRYKELIVDKAVSQQEFDDVSAALKQAEADVSYWKAAVESARINLGYTKVTAPISGRIGKSNVTEGALVTANQPMALTTIQQIDPIYVDIPQSTTELADLRRRLEEGRIRYDGIEQKKIKLAFEDGRIYPQEGTMQFRDITVDPTTGSVIIRAIFPNKEARLLPGMFVRAIVKEGVNKDAILIPQEAVSRDPKGNPYVLVLDKEGKAQVRPIILDRAIGNRWLVQKGISVGDQVITEGIQRVRPGVPVKVSAPKEGGADQSVPGAEKRPSAKTN